MENNILTSKGRDIEEANMTNLEYIIKNPTSIMRPSDQQPLNLSDMIEYNIIKEMLNKIKNSKNKKI